MITRRTFAKQAAAAAAVTAVATSARAASAASYMQIAGANERVNFATMGLNGRGYAHLSALKANKDRARLVYCADVDKRPLAKFSAKAEQVLGYSVKTEQDFRKVLESKDVDAITIATPDHWHAPMAVLGLKANKHVYVEKPSSHNPREGELLIAAQEKYKKCVQVGDQQRSSDHTIKIINQIHQGLIGDAYFAEAWYVNTRKPIGVGKVVPVPDYLDWDLWQGPAPRSEYKDNIHPYNWHWLFRYGTGETLNNGTHEVDIARWALNEIYPDRVTCAGGRFAAKDDWQFPDTTTTSFDFGTDKTLTWIGKSCNGMLMYNRDRGICVHGTKGSVIVDRVSYEVYDNNGKQIDSYHTGSHSSTHDTIGQDSMTDAHFANFIDGVTKGAQLHSPIQVANVSVTILQLSNIAWRMQRELKLDNKTGHILHDAEAMKLWGRDYQKGWEVTV